MKKLKKCPKCGGKGSEKAWGVLTNKKGEITTEMRLFVCSSCLGTGYAGLRR